MINSSPKHFLSLENLSTEEIAQLINRAIELKILNKQHKLHRTLEGKVLAMIFEKASTRTRLSFETGIIQLGGQAVFLSSQDTQLGRGEAISDTARVISSMVDCIMIRTDCHQKLLTLAEYSQVPVINGLTDEQHPCQLLADLMTMVECYGSIEELKKCTISWIGDGNNMCNSTIQLANILNLKLHIYTPKGYEPAAKYLKKSTNITLCNNLHDAMHNSNIIITDVWASMGDEEQEKQRKKDFAHCQVNQEKMQLAHKDAIFLHCLPAHRGEEVTSDVIDGTQSKVWQQAENRLHSQKALMELLLT